MKPNYCLPILKPGKSEILGIIQANLADYRYFEVWLDYVGDADEPFIKDLLELLGGRLIVTFRRQGLESPRTAAAERRKLLGSIAGTPAMVDLDISTQKDELEHAENMNLIASYHNYDETPDTLQLGKIIDTMETYRPAVYKLSTLCRAEGDAVRLLQLLIELRSKGMRAIVSGMGEHGVATRVFGPLWGSEMAFAPLDEDSLSAPGQLTRQRLETIFKELGE